MFHLWRDIVNLSLNSKRAHLKLPDKVKNTHANNCFSTSIASSNFRTRAFNNSKRCTMVRKSPSETPPEASVGLLCVSHSTLGCVLDLNERKRTYVSFYLWRDNVGYYKNHVTGSFSRTSDATFKRNNFTPD